VIHLRCLSMRPTIDNTIIHERIAIDLQSGWCVKRPTETMILWRLASWHVRHWEGEDLKSDLRQLRFWADRRNEQPARDYLTKLAELISKA
jgi:hypothetical protein